MKKILLILLVLSLGVLMSWAATYNGSMVIIAGDYRITTHVSAFLALQLALFFIMAGIVFLLNIVFRSRADWRKREKKLIGRYDSYIKSLSEAFVYLISGDYKNAKKMKKQADRSVDNTSLSKLLEAQLLFSEKEYIAAAKAFRQVKGLGLRTDFISLKLKLHKAKQDGNIEKIKKYSGAILKIQPANRQAVLDLYKAYREEKDWINAERMVEVGLKIGAFDRKTNRREIAFIYVCRAYELYKTQQYHDAIKYASMAQKIDPRYASGAIIMAKSYIKIGKNAYAVKTIRRAWKYAPNIKLSDMYMELFEFLDDEQRYRIGEKLYKINDDGFVSNIFMARIALEAKKFMKARKYAKKALTHSMNRAAYEVILEIERQDHGNTNIIESLMNKLESNIDEADWKCSVCGRVYDDWQFECDKCHSLDTISWSN